jgi:carbon starvation protein
MVEMNRVVLNDRVDAALCALFMAVVVSTVLFGLAASRRALAAPGPTTHEEPDFALQPRRVGPRHA